MSENFDEKLMCIWAKKRETNGQFFWLPLKQHLEDTANVIEHLWDRWLSEGQRNFISAGITSTSQNSLDGEEPQQKNNVKTAKNLAIFLAAIHDIGKATPAFCTKKGYVNSPDLDLILLDKLEERGFEDIRYFNDKDASKSPHNIAGQYLLHEYGVGDDISSIIGAHHGKPVNDRYGISGDGSYLGQGAYLNNYYQNGESKFDSESETHKKWDKLQRQVLKWALERSKFNSVKELPAVSQSVQVLLLGLLIMADWIASNEEYFPLINIEQYEVDNNFTRINGYFKWAKSDVWKPKEIKNVSERYKARFGSESEPEFKPRDVQKSMAETVMNTKEPGIFILEATTGIGKTEAALIAAEELACKTGRSGLFFGLPTQATSNGIFPRIVDWMGKLEKLEMTQNDNTDSDDLYECELEEHHKSIRLCHGKAYLNEVFRSLASSINVDESENAISESEIIVNQWFSGRKTAVLDDFVVGTVDQLLMMSLKQKHLALRHLGLSKKVVIIDEVHAYDAYMSQYLKRTLQWLGAYKVPVILLSATLPAQSRLELLNEYQNGRAKNITDDLELKRFRENRSNLQLISNQYPIITYTDGYEIKQKSDFPKAADKEIQIKRISDENLKDLLENFSKQGGVVGVIVNTVKRAQLIGSQLLEKFGDETVDIIHSAFIATDRATKEEKLLKTIGKDGDRPEFKIIIGTQVLEQSLDIDFDVLITDLAPMDLLLQRIGRLQRHDIDRDICYKEPTVYIMGLSETLEFEKGSSIVYGNYLLTKTQYYLPDTEIIKIPGDIPELVNKVYANEDEEMDIPEDLKRKYSEFKKEHEGKIDSLKVKAKAFQLSSPTKILGSSKISSPTRVSGSSKISSSTPKNSSKSAAEKSLIGWLKSGIPVDSEEKASAKVRDTEDTIEVIAVKKIGTGYGSFGTNEDISGRVEEDSIAKELAKQTFILPKLLSKNYNIDDTIDELEKYNRNYLRKWQTSTWLKGSLGIIFDENDKFIVSGVKLKYSKKLGILYDMKGSDDFGQL